MNPNEDSDAVRSVALPRETVLTLLDLLEGTRIICERLHVEGRGRRGDDALVEVLQLEGGAHDAAWEPLRYQSADGMGWKYVAELAAGVREGLYERSIGRW